jgi:shikimate 5-dehydrogenase
MSRLLLKHMGAKGCSSLVLLNRSLPRAEELAAEFPDISVDIRLMDRLGESIAECDTVFTGTPLKIRVFLSPLSSCSGSHLLDRVPMVATSCCIMRLHLLCCLASLAQSH